MSDRPIRIAINGFGRIGRSILRLAMTGSIRHQIEVALINDVAAIDMLEYLFRYDSVFGPYPGTVLVEDDALVVDGHRIAVAMQSDLSTLDLSHIDLVLECTGRASSREVAERGLRAGAGKVLISGPSPAADKTIVLGANDEALKDQLVLSNASCTTNALAPLLKVLDEAYGIESGHMTTVHCYTGSQPTVDTPRATSARSRAAALSMVPTTTSAAQLIADVLPHLAGRVEARAIRVPTASVSCIDLAIALGERVSIDQVNQTLAKAIGPIIGSVSDRVVSTDMRMRPESIVMVPHETSVSRGGIVRVFGWYDNEWGFSNRMLEMARLMAEN